ncbi:P-loop containing nucleoside triphosphate hydrolase protein [Rhizophagus diaphanus]|nr:P-loop containing nucleoside triphosphate hydrolase protein [Rhizophagus diaphanus] [Rhizophagus sp. MUCL 43196]
MARCKTLPRCKQQPKIFYPQQENDIRVCVRKRPLSEIETLNNERDIADIRNNYTLKIDKPRIRANSENCIERHSFTFNEVFDENDNRSGKTFTMFDQSYGLCAFAAQDIFTSLKDINNSHLEVYVSFYEINRKELHDLLDNRKKIMRLKERHVENDKILLDLIKLGNTNRSTGSTGAILQIVLKHKNEFHGKISFVDLAGNDRELTDMKSRMEINKSLLTLCECIRALDQNKKRIPFRDSKLTQVLEDSFVENSRTCMIATISPNESNIRHTFNTLRYACRIRFL